MSEEQEMSLEEFARHALQYNPNDNRIVVKRNGNGDGYGILVPTQQLDEVRAILKPCESGNEYPDAVGNYSFVAIQPEADPEDLQKRLDALT